MAQFHAAPLGIRGGVSLPIAKIGEVPRQKSKYRSGEHPSRREVEEPESRAAARKKAARPT